MQSHVLSSQGRKRTDRRVVDRVIPERTQREYCLLKKEARLTDRNIIGRLLKLYMSLEIRRDVTLAESSYRSSEPSTHHPQAP